MNSLGFRLVGAVVAVLCVSPPCVQAQTPIWRRIGPEGASNITGLGLNPADPLVVYATSDSGTAGSTGIWKSLDGGQTWIELGAGDPELSRATCIAVGVINPNNVYVGTASGLVAASHDAGATWTKASAGGSPGTANPVTSIAVQPATGSIHAAMRETETCFGVETPVSRSPDIGATWNATNFGQAKPVLALLADPLGSAVFAGTNFHWSDDFTGFGCAGGWGGGVERTADGGANWSLSEIDLGFPVTALAADRRGAIVAGTEAGRIFRSEDSGATWVPLGVLPGAVAALAIDAADPSNLYAGLSSFGIWHSTDGGTSWRSFDAAIESGAVRSLAIDPTGRILFAGTPGGVFRRNLPAAVAGSCERGSDHLCLLGSRFRVELHAIDPASGSPAPPRAFANGERFGFFSLPTLPGDPELPEVFVRIDDATALPEGGHAVFTSSLTRTPYSVVVTDTANGRVRLYDGRAFCGTADTRAFPAESSESKSSRSRRPSAVPEAAGGELALLSGRFRISASAADPSTGAALSGAPVSQGDRFGYFTFPALAGDPASPEVLVEMLDARSFEDGDFAIAHGGMTSLPYTLTVRDSVSGLARIYRSDPIEPARPCGSVDKRVTTGPPPADLSGDWPGTSAFSGTLPRHETSASVSQSGHQISIRGRSEQDAADLRFTGTVHEGVLAGVFQYEGGVFRTCHIEATAGGTATESTIQLTTEPLAGSCGNYGPFTLDLIRGPESESLHTKERQ